MLFDFNQGVTGEYQYYKVVVSTINGANYMQMSEMTLCTPEQFPDYVKPIADEYTEYDLNQAAYKGYLDAYTNLLPGLASVTSVAQLDAVKAQLDKAKEQIAASVIITDGTGLAVHTNLQAVGGEHKQTFLLLQSPRW